MARVVVVEVVDQRAVVRQRVRLDRFPATVGRGYDNDLILDDRFVSPRHLRLAVDDESGELVAEDLGSVNGLLLPAPGGGRRPERRPRVPIRSGTALRVGHTVLRFFDPAHPVPDALVDAGAAPPGVGRLRSPAAKVGVAALVVGALVLQAWLGSSGNTEADDLAGEAVAGLVGLLVWSGAWALASRLVSHRFSLLSHLTWAGVVLVALLLLSTVGEWLEFFAPSNAFGGAVGGLAGVALAAVLLYGHLTIIGTMTRRGRWIAAGSVTVGLAAVAALLSVAGDESTWSMDYSATLKPVPARLVPAASLADFVAGAAELKADVDELAREDAEAGGGEGDARIGRPDTAGTAPRDPR